MTGLPLKLAGVSIIMAVAASGATTLALSPGVQYARPPGTGKALTLEAGVQIPVLERGDLGAAPDYTAYLGGYVVF